MSTIREYRKPILIAVGALVVAIILWIALISSQTSKLSKLQAQSTQLQTQETALQARLTSLQSEGQKLSSNCADLQTISTQIPSVQSPTDIDAEESSFESQFNSLAAQSGVSLAQFNGFAPASTTGSSPASTKPAAGGSATASAGVTAVPTTLAVQGNYGQISAFINGLDKFPRLFVIQNFVLAYGAASTSTTPGGASSSSSGGLNSTVGGSSGASSGPPLWVGGTPTSPSAGPYNLSIDGSIYYTTTPNALSACTQATAAQTTK